LGGRKGIRPVKNLGDCEVGGAVSPVGVAPTRTVGTSASIIFPCSIKRQEVGKPSLNAAQPYAKAEGRVFLLVPAYLGCPGRKAVKRLLLLLLLLSLMVSYSMLNVALTCCGIYLGFGNSFGTVQIVSWLYCITAVVGESWLRFYLWLAVNSSSVNSSPVNLLQLVMVSVRVKFGLGLGQGLE